jgi:hypothetical protein
MEGVRYHVVIRFSLCKNYSSIDRHMKGFIHLTAAIFDRKNILRDGLRKVEVQKFVDYTLRFRSDCLVLFISIVNKRPGNRSCNCFSLVPSLSIN